MAGHVLETTNNNHNPDVINNATISKETEGKLNYILSWVILIGFFLKSLIFYLEKKSFVCI